MTPKNIRTDELLALTATPATRSANTPALIVRVWNRDARKWLRTSDAALIEKATAAAIEYGGIEELESGDTAFIGEVYATRVLVELL